MNVDSASSGAETLETACRKRAGCVRSDVRMPVMNDLRLRRKLRAQPLYPCTPAPLLITGGRALARGTAVPRSQRRS